LNVSLTTPPITFGFVYNMPACTWVYNYVLKKLYRQHLSCIRKNYTYRYTGNNVHVYMHICVLVHELCMFVFMYATFL